ncbi:MAG: DUF975 family protein [Oscillospiraceae bacterium]|nr:DUF975 family protein [Oscillospiraceae bacterium]
MKSRQEIKALAKEAMREQRGTSILLVVMILVWSVIISIVSFLLTDRAPLLSSLISFAFSFFVIVWGINTYGAFVKVYQREQTSVGEVASNLKVNTLRKIGGTYWIALWLTLWTMLLVIPGIIKGLAYYFAPNILADRPEVTARQALKLSMRMTQGHKGRIFVFILSWIGWFILSGLTFGILYIVYVGPYWYAADAGYYVELRDNAIAEGRVTREELGMEEQA